jgi:hypothetical protein
VTTPTITLGGAEYPLDVLTPLHQAYAYDVASHYDTRTRRRASHRVHAAAVMLACGRIRRKLGHAGTIEDHGGEYLRFGGVALAALLEAGATMQEIHEAGAIAAEYLCSTLPPPDEEVRAAAGNSDATPAPSSSPA